MWVCPEDLTDVYSKLPPPPLKLSSDKDLGVSELAYVPYEERLKKQIDIAVRQWKELDKEYLIKRRKNSKYASGSSFLALPAGINLWNEKEDITGLSHPQIPDEKVDEYYSKLRKIFASIPRHKDTQTNTMERPLLRSVLLKRDLDGIGFQEASKRLRGVAAQTDTRSEFMSTSVEESIHTKETVDPGQEHFQSAVTARSGQPPRIGDSVITVSIHSAFEVMPEELKQQEFELLGSNTLTDLRHAIYCVNGMLKTDGGEDGEACCDSPVEDCTDSYFFIEGKLYMDLESDQAVEYFSTHNGSMKGYPLRPISWLETVKKSSGGMAARDGGNVRDRFFPPGDAASEGSSSNSHVDDIDIIPMGSVQLKSLRFRAGVRYLYCHMQQRCEHYLYFSDVRVFHPVVDSLLSFPRLTFLAKFHRRKCEVCFLWSAQFITYGDRLAVSNPMLFCQHCYHMLHYRKDGSLLYDDFSVFPYLHQMN